MKILRFFFLFGLIGCKNVYKIADSLIDNYYFKERIEQYCVDATIEGHSLILNQKSSNILSQNDNKTLKNLNIDAIIDLVKSGSFHFKQMKKFKKKISGKVNFFDDCKKEVSESGCHQFTTPNKKFSCLEKNVQKFFLNKLITSNSFQKISKADQEKFIEEYNSLE